MHAKEPTQGHCARKSARAAKTSEEVRSTSRHVVIVERSVLPQSRFMKFKVISVPQDNYVTFFRPIEPSDFAKIGDY